MTELLLEDFQRISGLPPGYIIKEVGKRKCSAKSLYDFYKAFGRFPSPPEDDFMYYNGAHAYITIVSRMEENEKQLVKLHKLVQQKTVRKLWIKLVGLALFYVALFFAVAACTWYFLNN